VKINGRRIRLEHLEENWKKYFRSNMVCFFDDSKLYLLVEGKVCRELLIFWENMVYCSKCFKYV